MSGLMKCIRAKWVWTTRGWVENGAVLIDSESGTTAAVGSFNELQKDSSLSFDSVADLDGAAIIPGLVNGHTHLELSAIAPMAKPSSYFSWVEKVVEARSRVSEEYLYLAFEKAYKDAFDSGTQFLGDITNMPFEPAKDSFIVWGAPAGNVLHRHIFWELIGFNVDNIIDALDWSQKRMFMEKKYTEKLSLVPHAVYSTSGKLIKQTFHWTRSRKRPFTIHVGEIEEENQFMKDGTGPCRDILEFLGRFDSRWLPPGKSSVEYLDELGALDNGTLLVHCVHLTESDWDLVKKRGSCICFCPRSNNFLDVGKADAQKAYLMQIPVLIGTDSLASNENLNLFEEALFLAEQNPSVEHNLILHSITYAGLRFFGRMNKKVQYLAVDVDENVSVGELSECVLNQGMRKRFRWIELN
ncbi:MAG: amidohydrolase family protein [Deltaproteobacteria bacterium]|nr:amidohydrolase family protein [Deltaproteobacteria bacterium]